MSDRNKRTAEFIIEDLNKVDSLLMESCDDAKKVIKDPVLSNKVEKIHLDVKETISYLRGKLDSQNS